MSAGLALAGGCAQILGLDDGARLGTPSTGTAQTSSATGAGGACDCTPANDCLDGSCADGSCSYVPKGAREPCASGVCDGAGSCVGCVVHDDCSSDRYCDTATHVCTPKKALGTTCTSSSQCTMGHCIDVATSSKICCSSDCTGNCEACLEVETNRPDGTCSPVLLGKDPKGGCAGLTCSSGTCDGSGACAPATMGTACSTAACNGQSIDPPDTCDANGQCITTPSVTCPGNLVCDPMANACITSCVSQTDCVSGYYCVAPFCQPKKGAGQNCQNGFECLSNVCMNGKCKP